MSTFKGSIAEFPGVYADHFSSSEPAGLFLLSHAHTDHLRGLNAFSFRGPNIYCSAATRLAVLARYNSTCASNCSQLYCPSTGYDPLTPLSVNEPHEVPVLGYNYSIQLTLIDAYHSPGSVMFLIQGRGSAVLFTGDVHAEPWYVDSLAHNAHLLPYIGGAGQGLELACVYADTSFINRSPNPLQPTVANSTGLAYLLTCLELYPPNWRLRLVARTSGYEEVVLKLAARFGPVYVQPDHYNSLVQLAPFWPLARALVPFLSQDVSVRLHACHPICQSCRDQTRVSLTPEVMTTNYVFLNQALARHQLTPVPERPDLFRHKTDVNCTTWYRHNPADPDRYLALRVRFPFSRHSSYGETKSLIRLFRPRDVCPIVEPKTPQADLTMRALFSGVCSPAAVFKYDEPVPESTPLFSRDFLHKNKRKQPEESDDDDDANHDVLERLNRAAVPKRQVRPANDDANHAINRATVPKHQVRPKPGLTRRREMSVPDSQAGIAVNRRLSERVSDSEGSLVLVS